MWACATCHGLRLRLLRSSSTSFSFLSSQAPNPLVFFLNHNTMEEKNPNIPHPTNNFSVSAASSHSNSRRRRSGRGGKKDSEWGGVEMMREDRSRTRGGKDSKMDRIDALGRMLTRILRHMADKLNLDMRSDGYVRVRDLLELNMTTFANVPLKSHSIDDIKEAVRRDNKQRFSLLEENGELLIRANQGHTIEDNDDPINEENSRAGPFPKVDSDVEEAARKKQLKPNYVIESERLLKPILSSDEAPVCVHGTYKKNLESILQSGLKRMKRLHVHFSSGLPTDGEVISGMRRDVNVLIFLDISKALEETKSPSVFAPARWRMAGHKGMKLYISDNKVILTEGFDGTVPVKYFEKIETWPGRQPIPF